LKEPTPPPSNQVRFFEGGCAYAPGEAAGGADGEGSTTAAVEGAAAPREPTGGADGEGSTTAAVEGATALAKGVSGASPPGPESSSACVQSMGVVGEEVAKNTTESVKKIKERMVWQGNG
jgi:hypothetical protein